MKLQIHGALIRFEGKGCPRMKRNLDTGDSIWIGDDHGNDVVLKVIHVIDAIEFLMWSKGHPDLASLKAAEGHQSKMQYLKGPWPLGHVPEDS